MKRINNFNDDYFETIDTEDKAYFLGLLFADGNVYMARHRVQITLANEDAYILNKFSECIGYSGKLYSDRGKYSKLILPSKKMCNDLISLGCTANKSLTLQFPTGVPIELLHHFIRGAFDGDGHVSKRGNSFNVNFTSSEDFMTGFIKLLKTINVNNTGSKKRYVNHDKSACQVYIKAESAKEFFNYIYKDSTVFLNRKKEQADKPNIIKMIKTCIICGDKHFSKDLCESHYRHNYYTLNGK